MLRNSQLGPLFMKPVFWYNSIRIHKYHRFGSRILVSIDTIELVELQSLLWRHNLLSTIMDILWLIQIQKMMYIRTKSQQMLFAWKLNWLATMKKKNLGISVLAPIYKYNYWSFEFELWQYLYFTHPTNLITIWEQKFCFFKKYFIR